MDCKDKKEKKQLRRAKAPRSRTGCRTCRIRHIKCDESRPLCRNCKISGRVCDGYAQQSKMGNERISPKDCLDSDASLTLSAILPETFDERRHFCFFQQRTAPELSGYFDKEFYNHLLLQISRNQPAIRHAVIALGALHESVKQQEPANGTLKSLSLRHYMKAIRELASDLADAQQRVSVTLICCVLFIWLETIQGNHVLRMQQLAGGLNILREWHRNVVASSCKTSLETQFIRDHLVPLFTRLDLQGVTLENGRQPQLELHQRLLNPQSLGIPAAFSSVEEARDWLDILLYWLHHSIRKINDAEIKTIQQKGHILLEQWEVALNEYLRIQYWTSDANIRACKILRIYQKMSTIMLETRMSHIESDYEPLNGQFQDIMAIVEPLFAAAQGTGKLDGFQFSFEMGVVAPLFYVSSKCQNQEIRARSLTLLLKCPRNGGVWDGLGVAKMSSLAEGGKPKIAERNEWADRYDAAASAGSKAPVASAGSS
ncbi:hypothetical protein B0O99DRAFT_592375 [Bisporella sp. PMI_857]|nr:hypothetical protein B0O99DRAFT_592375 [Bisporella sp. PMI_857]